jgi:hypothetical protein
MNRFIVAAFALTIGSLGCSKGEAPQPPAPAPSVAAAKPAQPPRPPKPAQAPANPLPTIVVNPPADVPPDPRRTVTPCDRKEPGWKWQGSLVEDGHCVVGPCICVKG